MDSNPDTSDITIGWPKRGFHLYKKTLTFQGRMDWGRRLSTVQDPMLLPISFYSQHQYPKYDAQWRELVYEGIGFCLLDLLARQQIEVWHFSGKKSFLNGLKTSKAELFQVHPLVGRPQTADLCSHLLYSIILHHPQTDRVGSWDNALKEFITNIFSTNKEFSKPNFELVMRILNQSQQPDSWIGIREEKKLLGLAKKRFIEVTPQKQMEADAAYRTAKQTLDQLSQLDPVFESFYQDTCDAIRKIVYRWEEVDDE
ncbi:MAG: hypothetical protein AAF206_23815 [Bacteroidota bacterium]